MNIHEARDIVSRIALIWPMPEISEPAQEAWAELLLAVDYDRAKLAVRELGSREPRQPHVSQVIQYVEHAAFRDRCRELSLEPPRQPEPLRLVDRRHEPRRRTVSPDREVQAAISSAASGMAAPRRRP